MSARGYEHLRMSAPGNGGLEATLCEGSLSTTGNKKLRFGSAFPSRTFFFSGCSSHQDCPLGTINHGPLHVQFTQISLISGTWGERWDEFKHHNWHPGLQMVSLPQSPIHADASKTMDKTTDSASRMSENPREPLVLGSSQLPGWWCSSVFDPRRFVQTLPWVLRYLYCQGRSLWDQLTTKQHLLNPAKSSTDKKALWASIIIFIKICTWFYSKLYTETVRERERVSCNIHSPGGSKLISQA